MCKERLCSASEALACGQRPAACRWSMEVGCPSPVHQSAMQDELASIYSAADVTVESLVNLKRHTLEGSGGTKPYRLSGPARSLPAALPLTLAKLWRTAMHEPTGLLGALTGSAVAGDRRPRIMFQVESTVLRTDHFCKFDQVVAIAICRIIAAPRALCRCMATT